MAQQEDMLKKAFKDLAQESAPRKELNSIKVSVPMKESKPIQESSPMQELILTKQQKEAMLKRILIEGRQSDNTLLSRFTQLIIVYPWKFAIIGSVLQAIVFTLIFGTKYTNLFLNYFGG